MTAGAAAHVDERFARGPVARRLQEAAPLCGILEVDEVARAAFQFGHMPDAALFWVSTAMALE